MTSMKKYLKRLCVAATMCGMLLGLCGCWDSRELDEIAFVLGAGVDKLSDDELVVTVQIADMSGSQPGSSSSSSSSSSTSSSSGGHKASFFTRYEEGKDICTAMQDMSQMLSRKLNYTHSQIFIIGDEVAGDGVRNVLDSFARRIEPRLSTLLFIGREDSIDNLEAKNFFEASPASEIAELIAEPNGSADKIPVTIGDFCKKLLSKTTSPIAPILELQEEDGIDIITVGGCAVFQGDRLVGELSVEESRGYQWVKGTVKYAIVRVESADFIADVMICNEKSKITPVIEPDGSLTVKVNIHAKGSLTNQGSHVNYTETGNLELLEALAQQRIREDVETTASRTFEMGTDIFGFGESFYRKYPKKWKALEPQWQKKYGTIYLQVEVKVDVISTGKIGGSLYPPKE